MNTKLFIMAAAFSSIALNLTVYAADQTVDQTTDKTADKAILSEQDCLNRLHSINQKEIAAGKLAQQKGQSDQIRKFGQDLVRDHTDADLKVENTAHQQGIQLGGLSGLSMAKAEQGVEYMRLKTVNTSNFDQTFVKEMYDGHKDAVQFAESAMNRLPQNSPTISLVKELLPKLKEHQNMALRLLHSSQGAP